MRSEFRPWRWWAASLGVSLAALAPVAAAAAENLAVFEVRVDGQVVKAWDRGAVSKLPAVEFTNRQGKKRTAVLLSTLLEGSGVPLERVASVTVSGLGGDAKKGPSTRKIQIEKPPGQARREITGGDVKAALVSTVVFYNPDRHWTLADLQRPTPQPPWDQNRVRKVRRIEVVLHRP